MKLFKTADEKFEALGFKKTEESDEIVVYNKGPIGLVDEYTHEIILSHRLEGGHLIQSSRRGVNSDGHNHVVPLTVEEAKLACKKIKQKGW